MGAPFPDPSAAVRELLAVQSQDYPGAAWAVGLRSGAATQAEVDAGYDAGLFVRTHALRPTWHFVAPEDLRWLQALTGARVHRVNGHRYRALEIDGAVAARAARVFERRLEGGRWATRQELKAALAADGIEVPGQRLAYLVMHAELEAIICSGPRRGKQHTYALVEERIAPSRVRQPDEALAELARRYVQGHGPAQDVDLAWWSGLTLRESRRALEAAGGLLRRETHSERTFWIDPGASAPPSTAAMDGAVVHLLPNYDELLIAFRDRSDAADPALPPPAQVATVILAHVAVREGLVVGGWRRRDDGRQVTVLFDRLVPLSRADRVAFRGAAARLSDFLGRPVELQGLD